MFLTSEMREIEGWEVEKNVKKGINYSPLT
jgi:hypothetical protein